MHRLGRKWPQFSLQRIVLRRRSGRVENKHKTFSVPDWPLDDGVSAMIPMILHDPLASVHLLLKLDAMPNSSRKTRIQHVLFERQDALPERFLDIVNAECQVHFVRWMVAGKACFDLNRFVHSKDVLLALRQNKEAWRIFVENMSDRTLVFEPTTLAGEYLAQWNAVCLSFQITSLEAARNLALEKSVHGIELWRFMCIIHSPSAEDLACLRRIHDWKPFMDSCLPCNVKRGLARLLLGRDLSKLDSDLDELDLGLIRKQFYSTTCLLHVLLRSPADTMLAYLKCNMEDSKQIEEQARVADQVFTRLPTIQVCDITDTMRLAWNKFVERKVLVPPVHGVHTSIRAVVLRSKSIEELMDMWDMLTAKDAAKLKQLLERAPSSFIYTATPDDLIHFVSKAVMDSKASFTTQPVDWPLLLHLRFHPVMAKQRIELEHEKSRRLWVEAIVSVQNTLKTPVPLCKSQLELHPHASLTLLLGTRHLLPVVVEILSQWSASSLHYACTAIRSRLSADVLNLLCMRMVNSGDPEIIMPGLVDRAVSALSDSNQQTSSLRIRRCIRVGHTFDDGVSESEQNE